MAYAYAKDITEVQPIDGSQRNQITVSGGGGVGSGTVTTVTSADGTVTVSNPNGPSVDISAALSLTNEYITARQYGVTPDAVKLTRGVLTSNSTTFIAYDAAFVAGDVGKIIGIPYGGPGPTMGQTFRTTIAAVVNATNITLTDTPIRTIQGERNITDGVTTSNSFNISSVTALFDAGDIGKQIIIPGVGPLNAGVTSANTNQVTFIATVTATNTATVNRKSIGSTTARAYLIPGAQAIYGTDNTAAWAAACAASSASRKPLYFDGAILITNEVTVANNLQVYGRGWSQSIIYPVRGSEQGQAVFKFSISGLSNAVTDVCFRDFQVDAIGCTTSNYTTGNKAFYIRGGNRITFERLYIQNTSATSIGCDYLRNYVMRDNIIYRGGRQVQEEGSGAGGSGLGVGTGYFDTENGLISGNTISDCGNNGIFTESQSSNIRSKGVKIIGNDVQWNGGDGISDRALDGTVISGNTSAYNHGANYSTGSGFVAGLYSINTLISGNTSTRCWGYDIQLELNQGVQTVRGNVLGNGVANGQACVGVTSLTPFTPKGVIIDDNVIYDSNGSGIYFLTGSNGVVQITNNKIVNSGLSTATRRPGIRIANNYMRELIVKGNYVTDEKAVASKFTSWALQLTNSVSIGRLRIQENNLEGCEFGEVDFGTATLTNVTYQPSTYVTKTADYTNSLNDYTVNFTGAGTMTNTLFASPQLILNKQYLFKNTGGGTMVLFPQTGTTIDGAASRAVTSGVEIQSNGTTNWLVKSSF